MTEAEQPSQDRQYNGWSNYATWAAHLWLSSTEEAYDTARGVLADAGDPHSGAEDLREWVEGRNPLEGGSMYSDILTWALQIVDWDEVARALGPDEWAKANPTTSEVTEG